MGTGAREIIKQAPQADGDGDGPFVADKTNYLSAVSGGPPALHGGWGGLVQPRQRLGPAPFCGVEVLLARNRWSLDS
jgi:hypothetical protein